MKPKIAIVILNWKQPQMTVETVDQFLTLSHPDFSYEVILIDSHSPDNSADIFQQRYQNNRLVKIIVTNDNYGTAEGNNFGIRYSLANAPGHEFHKNRYSQSDQGKVFWFVGGMFDWNNVNGYHLGVDEIDHGQYDQPNENLDYLTGCCVLVDNKIFSKIDIMNPYYFMYLEDIDLCQRAKRAGYKLSYCPDACIWHINAGSSGGVGSNLQDYFLTRNRLYFGYKFCSFRTKFALFRESLRTLFTSPSKWQKKGVIDFYLGVSGKGSWQ